jgi:hypothetical protein
MFARLWLRLRVERRDARATSPPSAHGNARSFLADGIRVCFANNTQVPAVHGVLRPHISLPEGIDRLLSAQELNAVLAHELTHATRRDNLICLVHQFVLCCLWFHPLVWIAGSRLAVYRELSCDEPVIQSARGRELISALAKLAHPERGFLLEATPRHSWTIASPASPLTQGEGTAQQAHCLPSCSARYCWGAFLKP